MHKQCKFGVSKAESTIIDYLKYRLVISQNLDK